VVLHLYAKHRIRFDKPDATTFAYRRSQFPPQVSIVMPVFNQSRVIEQNLTMLLQNISLPCELIILDDASEDDSETRIRDFLENHRMPDQLVSATLVSFKKARFETMCDDFGIRIAQGETIIEIQADTVIQENGFDSKLVNVLNTNADIFMLSGRGIMDFASVARQLINSLGTEASMSSSIFASIKKRLPLNTKKSLAEPHHDPDESSVFPDDHEFKMTKRAGRLGRKIENNTSPDSPLLYVGETVMRGPIAFSRRRYELVGGLDTNRFFLGFDEHDLNLRARIHHGWKAGYTPISFDSPLANGSMRKKRTMKTKVELFLAVTRIRQDYKLSELYRFADTRETSYSDHHRR
jgi:GT2 family glycosyltransferase